MERKMWPVEVGLDDQGFICISQDVGPLEEDPCIVLHPDQVELLIQWLNDAKNELQRQ